MAVELTLRTASPARLTDIKPGRVRTTLYAERSPALTPLAAFLIGTAAAPLVLGAGRALTGGSARSEARELLENELLAAKIAGEKTRVQELQGRIALLAREFDPVSEEERELKVEAIRGALPLDLARREVTIEGERAKIAREDQIFPLVFEARDIANQLERGLIEDRAQRTAAFLETEAVRRENIAEQTEKQQLLNEQLERQNELIAAAVGPLDQAQLAQFARERLFPPGKVLPFAPIGALSVSKFVTAGAGF